MNGRWWRGRRRKVIRSLSIMKTFLSSLSLLFMCHSQKLIDDKSFSALFSSDLLQRVGVDSKAKHKTHTQLDDDEASGHEAVSQPVTRFCDRVFSSPNLAHIFLPCLVSFHTHLRTQKTPLSIPSLSGAELPARDIRS
jgi:hypothetical protein